MYEYRCVVLEVIDGDTVDVDIDLGFGVWLRDERIRLADIDTPEVRTRDLVEKQHGTLAKNFVTSYLMPGTAATLHSKSFKGKFGRILGDFSVYDNTTDSWRLLTTLLVENRLAVPYLNSKEEMEQLHLENRKMLNLSE